MQPFTDSAIFSPPLPLDLRFFERGWLSSNSVMLFAAEHACIVDTGYVSHSAQTADLVASALGRRHELAHILNTHLHSDHCGGNAQLSALYPSAEVWIPEPYGPAVEHWDTQALSHEPTGQDCPRFAHHQLLSPEQPFCFGRRSWQIHQAPGHDDWAVMLYCPDDRILISGDALWGNGFGVVFPAIYSDGGFERVGQTLSLIEQLDPKWVIPGHGGVFTDVGDSLDRARSRLSHFLASPRSHAVYAAKVLIKFKLLEWQQIEWDAFVQWAQENAYLHRLHASHFHTDTFMHWINDLIDGLTRSDACRLESSLLINS